MAPVLLGNAEVCATAGCVERLPRQEMTADSQHESISLYRFVSSSLSWLTNFESDEGRSCEVRQSHQTEKPNGSTVVNCPGVRLQNLGSEAAIRRTGWVLSNKRGAPDIICVSLCVTCVFSIYRYNAESKPDIDKVFFRLLKSKVNGCQWSVFSACARDGEFAQQTELGVRDRKAEIKRTGNR